jgi:chemotaxis protein CheD
MEIFIGPSDMQISSDSQTVLSTEPLASGIGMAAYDAGINTGGILYFVLPSANSETSGLSINPFLFGDIGIPMFLNALAKAGCQTNRLKVVVAGGAAILNQKGDYNIAGRNQEVLKKVLKKNQITVAHAALGGAIHRRIRMNIQTGRIHVAAPGRVEERI